MLMRSLLCLMLLGLTACATIPAKNPEAERKLAEAGETLDTLNESIMKFHADIAPLRDAVKTLKEDPLWPEMEAVLTSAPSLQTAENPEEEAHRIPAFQEGERKWKRQWKDLFARYQGLSDRCTIMEAKRTALVERLMVAEAKYLEAFILENTAGRKAQAESIALVMDSLNRVENDLSVYKLTDLGLYETPKPVENAS